MRWKRLVCLILGHKWEYLSRRKWRGRARGCLRCNKREAQWKDSEYLGWCHVDWSWDWFKKFQARWEKRVDP